MDITLLKIKNRKGLKTEMLVYKYISKKMVVLSLAYFMVITISSIVSATKGISNSLFDYILNFRGGGSASVLTLTVGVLPILALVIPMLMDQFESDMIVVRVRRKRKLFYEHFNLSIYVSACLTILMALSGIAASLIATGHANNLWGTKEGTLYFWLDNKNYFPLYISHVTSLKVWGYILTSRFLAILFIATCIIFLKLILRKNIYVFFVSLILLGIDGFSSERLSLFMGRARMKMDTWLAPEDQLFNLGYFILVIIILSLICLKRYDKKEFYQ